MSKHHRACEAHCRACDSCLTSTRAFDVHRAGDHATGRYCVDLDADPRFEVKTNAGRCSCSSVNVREPIVLWTLREATDASQDLQVTPEKPSEAQTGGRGR
jgi:hypothetical protein